VERKNYGCWAVKDAVINSHADSLNFWSAGVPLPDFVSDSTMDWWLIRLGGDCFIKLQFISYRKAILDRVVNEEVLVLITKAKDERLDKLYDPKEMEKKVKPSIHTPNFPDLPYMKYSTRQLAEQRLKVLRETKDRFKFKKK